MIPVGTDQMAIGIGRRQFISAFSGLSVMWPLAARAQQPERMRRIGVLQTGNESDPEWQRRIAIFVQGLQELGWKEGANVVIDYRLGGEDSERIRLYAAELVSLKPDVIWTGGGLPVLALKRRPTPSRLSSRRSTIQSAVASSRAWRSRVAT